MLAMSFGFAALYTYLALHPLLLADGVDPGAVRGSIVRFSAIGIGCMASHSALPWLARRPAWLPTS
jgi:hypothetical protein